LFICLFSLSLYSLYTFQIVNLCTTCAPDDSSVWELCPVKGGLNEFSLRNAATLHYLAIKEEAKDIAPNEVENIGRKLTLTSLSTTIVRRTTITMAKIFQFGKDANNMCWVGSYEPMCTFSFHGPATAIVKEVMEKIETKIEDNEPKLPGKEMRKLNERREREDER
jgi:hypothetical protein